MGELYDVTWSGNKTKVAAVPFIHKDKIYACILPFMHCDPTHASHRPTSPKTTHLIGLNRKCCPCYIPGHLDISPIRYLSILPAYPYYLSCASVSFIYNPIGDLYPFREIESNKNYLSAGINAILVSRD